MRAPSFVTSRRAGRVGRGMSLVAVACLLAAALAVPGPSPAAARAVEAGRVQVLSPRPGALVVKKSKKAAANTKVTAWIRLAGGPVARLSVRLNGRRVGGVVPRLGKQRLLLSKRNGLRVGSNSLFVDATLAGSGQPLQAVRRFVVGYRATHVVDTSRIRRGAGAAPAALVKARAPLKRVHQVAAWLNGRRLDLPDATRGRHARRVLDLNLAHLGRLRFGRNLVRFRVAMNDGRVQSVRRTFTLDRYRDIAVTRFRSRPDGEPVVGRTLTLDGSRSRLAGGRLHGHWSLLRRPTLSHARLGAADGTMSSLRPDVPGTYEVGFRTRSGTHAGYDTLYLGATPPPDHMVPVDTAATQGEQQGMQVGDQFYAWDDSADFTVVQLDGYTLEATHYNTYDATSSSLSQMKSDLSTASPSALVFIARPDGRPDLPSAQVGNIDAAVGEVGGFLAGGWRWQDGWCSSVDTTDCQFPTFDGFHNSWFNISTDLGPFTMVGTVGMSPGQGWRETAQQTGGSGGISGYLTVGVPSATSLEGTYTLIPGPEPYVPVVTCAAVGGPVCGVTVGDQTYQSPGTDGIHVVVLNRTTLEVRNNETVTDYADLEKYLNASTGAPDPTASQAIAHFVYDQTQSPATPYPSPSPIQSDQSVVILQSVGNGSLTGTPTTNLYQLLTQLGGTPEALTGSQQNADPYALIGVADNLPWYGTSAMESSAVMATNANNGQPNGTINSMLERGNTGLFSPVTGSQGGAINSDLFAVVFEPDQPWPYPDDLALSYIADNIGMSAYDDSGPQPVLRSAYTTDLNWTSKFSLLSKLTCTDESLCGPNFAAVKAEILLEFTWLTNVQSLMTSMLAPYDGGSTAIFEVDAIYDDVRNSLPPPPPVSTSLNWLGIVTGIVGLAAAIAAPISTPASEGISIVGNGLQLANDFMQAPDGGSTDTVVADAPDQLSAQLADQEAAAVAAIKGLEPILLSDYGRLSAIGPNAGGEDVSWTPPADDTPTVDAMNANTRAETYTSLIPEIYAATVLLPNSDISSTYATTNDVSQYECDNDHHPFADALAANQFHAISRVRDGTTQSNVWTFANDVSSGSPQMPTTSLTDDIYGPDAFGSNGAGQYAPNWWRTTYNPPGGVQCSPPNSGSSWPAPSVPPPPP
jgi:hypothetical protein